MLDNRHIRIDYPVWNALTRFPLSNREMSCLMYIISETLGYNKSKVEIPLKSFVCSTGMSKDNVCKMIRKLTTQRIIFVSKKANRTHSTYKFNTTWPSWKTLLRQKAALQSKIMYEIKAKIRQRDNHTCMLCGIVGNPLGHLFHVHHIDFNQTNNKNDNLITVCKKCHAKSHTVAMKEKLSKMIISINKKANELFPNESFLVKRKKPILVKRNK